MTSSPGPSLTWEPSEWQARFLPETNRWVLREDDPRFHLSAGDVLLCMPYHLDPGTKLTVVARESDGYDPSCNVYRSQVEKGSQAPCGDANPHDHHSFDRDRFCPGLPSPPPPTP